MTDYDVVVVGAGVAGLPAALFTGAMGLRTLVLEASALGCLEINLLSAPFIVRKKL